MIDKAFIKKYLKHIVCAVVFIQTIFIIILFIAVFYPSENFLRESHYKSEVATLVSPHSLRENILHGKNNFIIVDTRDRESYEKGHIVGALNIEPDDTMVEKFRDLEKTYIGRPILIYCYTQVCLRGRKIGKELARNGIYVQELGIGFNEWKNFWRTWNYENEWNHVSIEDYIAVGSEPGWFKDIVVEDVFKSSCSTIPGFEC